MSDTPETPRLLRPADASVAIGRATSTLAKMRMSGDGPVFVKVGVSVYYPEDSLRDWLAKLPRFRSTAEVSVAAANR